MSRATLTTVCLQRPHTSPSRSLSVRPFSLHGIRISDRRCLYGCVWVFSTRADSTSGFWHILHVHPFPSMLCNPWLMLRNGNHKRITLTNSTWIMVVISRKFANIGHTPQGVKTRIMAIEIPPRSHSNKAFYYISGCWNLAGVSLVIKSWAKPREPFRHWNFLCWTGVDYLTFSGAHFSSTKYKI